MSSVTARSYFSSTVQFVHSSAYRSRTSSDCRGWERRCLSRSRCHVWVSQVSPSPLYTLSHMLRLDIHSHTHEYHCSSSSCEYTRFAMATWDCTYASKLKGFTSLFWNRSACFRIISKKLQYFAVQNFC